MVQVEIGGEQLEVLLLIKVAFLDLME